MRAKLLHYLQRAGVRITTGKSDEVDVVRARLLHDQAGHVMRAFDEISHGHTVADALATVGTKIALHGLSLSEHLSSTWLAVYARASSRSSNCEGEDVRPWRLVASSTLSVRRTSRRRCRSATHDVQLCGRARPPG